MCKDIQTDMNGTLYGEEDGLPQYCICGAKVDDNRIEDRYSKLAASATYMLN